MDLSRVEKADETREEEKRKQEREFMKRYVKMLNEVLGRLIKKGEKKRPKPQLQGNESEIVQLDQEEESEFEHTVRGFVNNVKM